MAQLMQDHRYEQEQGGEKRGRPDGRSSHAGPELRGIGAVGRQGDHQQDGEPGGMDPQGNAADLHQLPTLAQGHPSAVSPAMGWAVRHDPRKG